MTATNAEILEGLLSTSINTQYLDTPPDEAEFNTKIDELRQAMAALYPVSDTQFEAIRTKLRKKRRCETRTRCVTPG